MSHKYEPASEPLHIYVKQLFLNRELYRFPQVLRETMSGAEARVLFAPRRYIQGYLEKGIQTPVAQGRSAHFADSVDSDQ